MWRQFIKTSTNSGDLFMYSIKDESFSVLDNRSVHFSMILHFKELNVKEVLIITYVHLQFLFILDFRTFS